MSRCWYTRFWPKVKCKQFQTRKCNRKAYKQLNKLYFYKMASWFQHQNNLWTGMLHNSVGVAHFVHPQVPWSTRLERDFLLKSIHWLSDDLSGTINHWVIITGSTGMNQVVDSGNAPRCRNGLKVLLKLVFIVKVLRRIKAVSNLHSEAESRISVMGGSDDVTSTDWSAAEQDCAVQVVGASPESSPVEWPSVIHRCSEILIQIQSTRQEA